LTPLLTGWRTRELPIHLLYPHRSPLPVKLRSFADILVERFEPDPGWDSWRKHA